jgi:hypothetical protein
MAAIAHRREDPRGKTDSISFVGAMLVPLVVSLILVPGWPSRPPDKAPRIELPVGSTGRLPHDPSDGPPLEVTITRDGRFWRNDGSELAPEGLESAARSYCSITSAFERIRTCPLARFAQQCAKFGAAATKDSRS